MERGGDGLPTLVWLEERGGSARCVIGRRGQASMEPVPGVLDTEGSELVRRVLAAPGEWAAVDEIGFLEQSSPAYQQALWNLLEHKRMLAVLRKEDLPFLNRLRERADCFVLDLDEVCGP
ncbi:nucleoside-triphosphatase [Lawsonibacter sp. LCP25S3_G6]|uniref:nucleoside-triphosphatase n=1 Tax=unclassified Lawsonibacter TaxID=2617946 RepID=UPI003F980914